MKRGEREVAMWDHLYSESRIKIPHHSILLFFFFFLILLLNFIFNLFLCLLILRQILVFVSPSLPLYFSLHLSLFLLSVWLNDKAWDESAFFFQFIFCFFFLVLLLLKTVAAVLLKILQFSTFNFFALLVLQKMENDANETCLLGVVPVPWYPLPIKKIKAMVQKQLKQIGSGKPETAACN